MATVHEVDEKKQGSLPEAVMLEDKSSSDSSDTPITWTVEEETKIRRKLDWQLVPMVSILYLLCFLDR